MLRPFVLTRLFGQLPCGCMRVKTWRPFLHGSSSHALGRHGRGWRLKVEVWRLRKTRWVLIVCSERKRLDCTSETEWCFRSFMFSSFPPTFWKKPYFKNKKRAIVWKKKQMLGCCDHQALICANRFHCNYPFAQKQLREFQIITSEEVFFMS